METGPGVTCEGDWPWCDLWGWLALVWPVRVTGPGVTCEGDWPWCDLWGWLGVKTQLLIYLGHFPPFVWPCSCSYLYVGDEVVDVMGQLRADQFHQFLKTGTHVTAVRGIQLQVLEMRQNSNDPNCKCSCKAWTPRTPNKKTLPSPKPHINDPNLMCSCEHQREEKPHYNDPNLICSCIHLYYIQKHIFF